MRTQTPRPRRTATIVTMAALLLAPALAASTIGAATAGATVDARARVQSSDSSSSDVLATLTVSSEKVSVRKDGKKKFKPAKDGQKLRQGDTIQTDATGTAEVDYGNDAFTRLDVNTTFTIVVLTDEQGARQVQGSLETGQTWNRTAALTESGSFEQEGAGANATVRGTAFSITCDTVDHCTFTAVVDDIDLTGLDGATRLLTPLTQCQSTDSTDGVQRDLSGVLCGDITQVPADQIPAWILQNLIKDLTLGLPDGGILTGTVVVTSSGSVVFVPGPNEPTATAPGAPTNVHATAGNGTATVSFSPPASNGGSSITSYTATATPSGGGPTGLFATFVVTPVSASGPSSPITITGLVDGVTYTFTVIATNTIGSGPSSAPSIPVTTPAPPTFGAGGALCVHYPVVDAAFESCPASYSAADAIAVEDELNAYFTANVTDPTSLEILLSFSVLPTYGVICARTTASVGHSCSGEYEYTVGPIADADPVTSSSATYAANTVFAYSPGPAPAGHPDYVPDVSDTFTIVATNSVGQSTSHVVLVTICENDDTYTCDAPEL